MWRRVNNEKNVFFEARPRLLVSVFDALFHLPYEKLNLSHNTVTSRSPCCCAFRVCTFIGSAPCLKKWSLSGILPPTHRTVPKGVLSLNR
jgi:hypothetical protein